MELFPEGSAAFNTFIYFTELKDSQLSEVQLCLVTKWLKNPERKDFLLIDEAELQAVFTFLAHSARYFNDRIPEWGLQRGQTVHILSGGVSQEAYNSINVRRPRIELPTRVEAAVIHEQQFQWLYGIIIEQPDYPAQIYLYKNGCLYKHGDITAMCTPFDEPCTVVLELNAYPLKTTHEK